MQGKPPRESEVTLSLAMGVQDANPLGNVHGGAIMRLVDEAGGLSAMRHAQRPCVTVVVDSMTFHSPVYVGNLVTLHARVNWVGRTSIEVGVRVEAENVLTGEKTHTNSAFVVYVALGNDGQPAPVPPLIPETDEDRRRMAEGQARQEHRLARRAAPPSGGRSAGR